MEFSTFYPQSYPLVFPQKINRTFLLFYTFPDILLVLLNNILREEDKDIAKDIAVAIDNSKQTFLAEEMYKWKINKQIEEDAKIARELENKFIEEDKKQLSFDECLKQINFDLSQAEQQVVEEFKNHWFLIELESAKCDTVFKTKLHNQKKLQHIERFNDWISGNRAK